MRRTQQQWLALFQKQSDSDLSIKHFCLEQCISTSSFYKHKAILIDNSQVIAASPFSQVQLIGSDTDVTSHAISISVGKVNMTIDAKTDTHWLANLIGQLA